MGDAKRRAAREAVGPGPRAVVGLVARARAQLAAGRFDAALDAAKGAVALAPGDAPSHHILGLAQFQAGSRQAALATLERAAALDPAQISIRLDVALARRAVGDGAGALDALADVCRALPHDAGVRYELAVTYETLGRPAEAEDQYRLALRIAPSMVNAHCGLARVLYTRGALDEARAAQRWAVTLNPRAIDDGPIGWAAPADGGTAALQASAAALEACRDSYAEGEDLAALVQARELKVVDDFEPDFEAWRAFALARRFVDQGSVADVNFPGLQTPTVHATPVQMQRIADAIGRDIKWRWPHNGAFRLSFEASPARSDIHVDEDVFRPMYAGVLYLSRAQDCRGGTSFWRHLETGWETIPADEEAQRSPYGDFRAFQRAEVIGDGAASSFEAIAQRRRSWRRLLEVPMRANRLILYRSDYFHSISEVFGSTPESARLVQLFFFEPR